MAGLYIHIPFCKKRCTYCDFHFSTTFEAYRARMVESIARELELRLRRNQQAIRTLYFGGGTPSLLHDEDWEKLMSVIQAHLDLDQLEEFTVECNPDDITEVQLNFWKEIGVNRLSIGIQSFNDEDLTWMNRAHTAEMSLNAIELTKKAGFDNFTIDLIYGLPKQDLDSWEKKLEFVTSLGIPHISAYCLTVEERTALYKWVDEGTMSIPDEEFVEKQFEILVNTLKKHGIEQYEVSNFSKPGREAIHNSNYWTGADYLGIGPSAHGKIGNRRYWNVANNQAYMKSIEASTLPETTEELSEKNQFNEMLMTGLRTRKGVSLMHLNAVMTFPASFDLELSRLVQEGVIIKNGGDIYLKPEALIKADYYASRLFVV